MVAGDPLALPVYLTTDLGAAVSYANLTAFQAAGHSLAWTDLSGASIAAPSATFAVTDAAKGRHLLATSVPTVDAILTITTASGFRAVPRDLVITATTRDEDDLAALITSSTGTPLTAERITSYDLSVTDGDSLAALLTFPVTALAPWGYSDLTTAGWTLEGAVRTDGDTSTGAPTALLTVALTNATTCALSAGWGGFPSAIALDAAALASGSATYRYDIQAKRTDTFAITAVTAGTNGTFTITGDQRPRFGYAATFTIASGPNAGTYTPTAITLTGGNTVLTVANVPSATVSGSIAATLTITGIRGTLTVTKQQAGT